MDAKRTVKLLERLLAVYEAKLQDWTVGHGEGSSHVTPFHGLELGYAAEVEALSTAIQSVRRHGVAARGIGRAAPGFEPGVSVDAEAFLQGMRVSSRRPVD